MFLYSRKRTDELITSESDSYSIDRVVGKVTSLKFNIINTVKHGYRCSTLKTTPIFIVDILGYF